MKLTGARAESFLANPRTDIIGVLLFGPDRGLVKERSQKLIKNIVQIPMTLLQRLFLLRMT